MKRTKYIIGVDEAGRGPLAGPIAVAAVAVRATAATELQTTSYKIHFLKGIRDSKKFSEKQREEWFAKLNRLKKGGMIDYAAAFSGAGVIDRHGIVRATRRAIARVLKKMGPDPRKCKILLDGTLKAPAAYKNQKTIIRGDDRVPIIAAASIVAKVLRDRKMKRLAKKFPKYGFEIHKGYGTRLHYRKLKKHGLSEIHRRSFLKGFKKTKKQTPS